MRIAFIAEDVVHCSGGSLVIVEHAAALERHGHEVHLLTRERYDVSGADWHPALRRLRVRHVAEAEGEAFDVVLATWWLTFFHLHRLRARVYGYLNQSLESRFDPTPWLKDLARSTYGVPLLVVTEARWLGEFVRMAQPGSRVLVVRNGLSREHFPRVAAPPERTGPLRVLVEGVWGVPFKGVAETFGLLEAARARGVRLETGWLTSDAKGARPTVGGTPVTVHERVPVDRVREVLGRYDVLVKLSRVEGMFAPPLEMFSQGGTAITTTVTGADEYMVHGHNGLLVEPYNLPQVSRYLEVLARDPARLAALRRNAIATAAAWPDWEASGAELTRALEAIVAEGWSNADVRPALSAVSLLALRWYDDGHRLARAGSPLGAVLHAVRDRLRGSPAHRTAKRLVPPGVWNGVRGRVLRVLR